ncbi:MAG TPA: YceI family protein [Planctomycetota bacterium]|nr:YceI family protein [Planctomycetota bacterium]
MRILTLLAGGLLFGAGAAAYHFAMPHEAPRREAPPPPPPDRTGEVLDEIASLNDALKAFATAIDAAADERQQLASALAAARNEGASGAADARRALAELERQIRAIARRQDDLAVVLAAKPGSAPTAVEAPAEAQTPPPAVAPPPAPEAPGPPKRKTLAELLAEKKRVDPRDELTRFRLLAGYCNVGFDGVSTIHNFTGQSKKVAGELRLHLNDLGDRPSGKLSVPTETLDSGNADRDADMRKALETPEIICEILGFDKKDARVRFTIKGVAKEMTVPLELTFEKGLLHAKGEAKLKMSDYGVKVKSAGFGMVKVDDEVTIWWDLYAEVLRDAPR